MEQSTEISAEKKTPWGRSLPLVGRENIRKRREAVALCMARGMQHAEIREELGLPEHIVLGDIKANRSNWRVEGSREIRELRDQELNYCYARREEVRELWEQEGKVGYSAEIRQWSMRIAQLMGLDMPVKTENVNLNLNASGQEISIFRHGAEEPKQIEAVIDGTPRLQATNSDGRGLDGLCEAGVRGDNTECPSVSAAHESMESVL